MNEWDWKNAPTPAAALVQRVLEENPKWTQQSVAMHLGESPNTIGRWLNAGGYRAKAIAEAAARAGYSPTDFGITDPVALEAAAKIRPTDAAPSWAIAHHAELMACIEELKKLVRSEVTTVRELDTKISNHLRKA